MKPAAKPCIFDDDEEEFNEQDSKEVAKKPSLSLNSNKIKKQTQIDIEKALGEDPNIFEYDNIYDKLEQEKSKLDPKLKTKNESKEVHFIK